MKSAKLTISALLILLHTTLCPAEENQVTRITLHVKDTPLPQVLAEISRQAGVEIGVEKNAMEVAQNVKISRDLDAVPFWQAVREICPDDWAPVWVPNGPWIALRPVGSGVGSLARWPMWTDGRFMVLATRMHATRELSSLKRNGGTAAMILDLKVLVDPRLKVLAAWQPATADRVQGSGNPLSIPANPSPGRYVPGYGPPWQLDIPLELFTQLQSLFDPLALRSLSGSLRVAAQDASEIWVIEQPLEARNLQREIPVTGEVLTFVEMKTNERNAYELWINGFPASVRAEKLPPLFSGFSSTGLLDRLHAYDAAGREFDRYTTGAAGSIPQGATAHGFLLQPRTEAPATAGPPVKVTIEIPTRFREVIVPFEFSDFGQPSIP